MQNSIIKNFLAIFVSTLIFILYFLPAYMMYLQPKALWGLLYLPLFIFSITWGIVLNTAYFKK